MKTKKFFMLLAAVLLSVSAFAQSGNNEPLKGDVNGDGVVDYADIDAVIEIMKNAGGYIDSNYYWYVGHVTNEQVESSSSLNTIVTNNGTSTTSTSGPSTLVMPTTTTGDVLVYIYPTVWGTPNIVDSTGYGTGDADIEEFGLTSPAGYKVRCWDPGNVEGKTLSITWSK